MTSKSVERKDGEQYFDEDGVYRVHVHKDARVAHAFNRAYHRHMGLPVRGYHDKEDALEHMSYLKKRRGPLFSFRQHREALKAAERAAAHRKWEDENAEEYAGANAKARSVLGPALAPIEIHFT